MKKQYNQPSLVLTTMATASFCNNSQAGDRQSLYTGERAEKNATKVDQSGNDVSSVLGNDQWAAQW